MKGKEFDNYGDAARYMREQGLDSLVVSVGNEVAKLYGNKYQLLSVKGVDIDSENNDDSEGGSKVENSDSPKKGGPKGKEKSDPKSSGRGDKKNVGQKVQKSKESNMTKNEILDLAKLVSGNLGGTIKEIDSRNQRAIITVNDEDIKLTAKALLLEKEKFQKPKKKRGRVKGSGKKEAAVLSAMADLKEFTVKDVAAKVENITETYAYMVIRDNSVVVRKDGKKKVYQYA